MVSTRPSDFKGNFKIYLGTGSSLTEWTHDTSHTVQELYTNGITIVPDSGYYVYQVLIGCNDGSGYNCKTAKDNNVGRIVATSTQSSTVTISANWLTVDATIGGKLVWHPGHGAPSYVMVMLKESPNPATVTYDAGAMAGYISGYLVAYDKDASGEEPKGATVTPSYDDDKDTAEIKYQKDGGLDEGTTHLILKPNTKQVTKDGKTYQFTGWSIQYIDANGNPQNFKDSSATTLVLYRDYVLTAQWKEVETPTTATITINKVFTDDTGETLTPSALTNFKIKLGETELGKDAEVSGNVYKETVTAGTYTVSESGHENLLAGYKFKEAKLTKSSDSTEITNKQIEVTAGQDDTYTLTNVYEKLTASNATKEVVCKDETITGYDIPNAITLPEKDGTTIKPILIAEGTTSITLLYRITVTGDEGASFKVTDTDTTLVYPINAGITAENGVYTGTVGASGTVFYVTKEFSPLPADKKLSNSITLEGKEEPIPGPDVPYTTPATITITKNFVDAANKSIANTPPASFKIKLGDAELTKDSSAEGNVYKATLNPGTYIVTEENYDIPNYTHERAFLRNSLEADVGKNTEGQYVITVVGGTDASYTLTNTYAKNEDPLNVTSTKKVLTSWPSYTGLTGILEERNVVLPYGNSYTATKDEESVTFAYEVELRSNKAATIKVTDDADYVGYYVNSGSATVTAPATGSTETTVVFGANGGQVTIYYTVTYRRNSSGEFPASVKNTAKIKVNDGNEKEEPSGDITITDKTPATFTFDDVITKYLTISGDYKFDGATFEATLKPIGYQPIEEISMLSANHLVPVNFDANSDYPAYTMDVTFGSNASWKGSTKFFSDLTLSFPKEGYYGYVLKEVDAGKTGVAYDDDVYAIIVTVRKDGNGELYVASVYYYWYNNEDQFNDETYVSRKHGYIYGGTVNETIGFENTVNTGYKSNDHIKIDSPNKLNTDDHYAYIIGYPDGTVQPNGEITRAEVATIFFRLLKDDVREKYFTKTNDFSDVSRDDWFNNPVSTMAELGIVKGYPDGTFRPNEPITRAEFAAIAARFDASTRYGETRFTDVAGHWAIREIAKAYNNGWIKGYPDNTFRPNRNITRAEAMTLINRVLNRAPETEKDLLSNMNKWSDNMDVDAWYYLAVQEATNSHDYRRKSSSYEHWIRMLEDPNWAKYER